VTLNLVRNAIDAMATSTKPRALTIATDLSGNDRWARVSIADSGPGLSEEVAQKLFQPFVTTKATGMGVGLSISRTIIEAHGGRIWAEANADGGATFNFTLQRLNEREVADAS